MSTPNPAPYYRHERPRSIFGPVVLTAIGIVLLLVTTGRMSWSTFSYGFAKYWPLLLILWGVAKLAEYLWARQKGYPSPRLGAGSVVFLIFFIMFGITASQMAGVNWPGVRRVIINDSSVNFDAFDFVGTPHEFNEDVKWALPGATQIRIVNGRGDVTITASNDGQAHGTVHKNIHADSDNAASRLNDSTHPNFQQQGGTWVLDLTGGDYSRGRFNLDLQLPRSVALAISTRNGNVSVSGMKGNVELASDHGDINADQISGDAALRLHNGKLVARNVTGNVSVEGGRDSTIADVGGTVTMTGSFPGEVELSHISKRVHFMTSRTDLEFAKLDGDLTMEMDSMRASGVQGPLRMTTKSKTIRLEDLSGDAHIENTNSTVELRPKLPLGNLDITNNRGEIDLTLPANAGFQLDAESKGGDIESDFNVKVDNSGNNASAQATVGKGGPTVRLKSDHGTIQIKKQ
jgi:DUF4097 and DUF4098 domain-containing protein YvlB